MNPFKGVFIFSKSNKKTIKMQYLIYNKPTMLWLKNNKHKKINKFKFKLKEHNFNLDEIEKLTKVYSKIRTLSNIFLINVFMIIISILIIIVIKFVDAPFLTKVKNNLHVLSGVLVGIFSVISLLLSIYVYIKILFINILEVKKKVLFWAIVSLIPGISFATFFVMKWKFSHIYRYRKNK